MTKPTVSAPRLFDPQALLHARSRAARRPVTFLLETVTQDLADRLALVKRPFERAIEIGSVGELVRSAIGRPDLIRLGPPGSGAPIVTADGVLPIGDASVDLVVSALALQAVEDLPGLLAQVRRALRPDGLFLAAMIGGSTLTELRQALTQAEAEVSGGVSPRVWPFVDVREAGALMQRAGFALPVTDADTLTVRYRSVFDLMADLRGMAATNILVDRLRRPTGRRVFLRMAEIYAARFSSPDGRVRASFEIVWLSGWAPHESQQKPLRPGSAKARLADALGTVERTTGDRGSPDGIS
ncbi:MAG: methyltransferase domain-containing protein [Labrys sp. (in: a-proteobacteria)]